MGLDPNLLNSLPDTLVDMYGLVEIDILRDMARRISTYDYFIPAAMHQNKLLQELGLTQQMIIEKLSALTGQTQQEIVDLLAEASAEAVADDVEYYKAAEVYEPSKVDSEALHAQLNSGLLQTQNAFFNITRTTANTASKQFERALDRAWTQINVGGMDYQTAVRNAVKDLSAAGIGAIEYKKGGKITRIDNIEVAVRRAVVTGANQTAMKTQEVLADELGVDLVETTAHGGARPEHAKWQGKVFSRKGRVTIDGITYEDFETATRYGHGDGLGGWNCRHSFRPYVPGTTRAYSEELLKEYEARNIEYNGEKYTEDEASKMQRGIERDIRALKRQVLALEEVGQDASEERKKLREAQKTYTDFTEQTGLKKQSARTQVEKVGKAPKTANNTTGKDDSPKKATEPKKATPKKATPKKPQTERQKLEEQARSLQGNFAKSMGISEDEAKRRFDALVSSNSDAQLKKFIKKYTSSDTAKEDIPIETPKIEYTELSLEEYKSMTHSVTKEERTVIYGRTHLSGYVNSYKAKEINEVLRTGGTLSKEFKTITDTLQSVIDKNTIPTDIQVVRYVHGDALEAITGVKMPKPSMRKTAAEYFGELDEIPTSIEQNHIYTEKGFMSTSGVQGKNVMQDKEILLKIKVPKGTHGYITTNYRESEIIFGQNTKLRIERAHIQDSGTHKCKVVLECIIENE